MTPTNSIVFVSLAHAMVHLANARAQSDVSPAVDTADAMRDSERERERESGMEGDCESDGQPRQESRVKTASRPHKRTVHVVRV
jgi:hypothetical protein